jgi:predicted helicase
MSALGQLLETFRTAAQSEREKGTYFEELVKAYLLNEPFYKDLLGGKVYLWEEWRAIRMREHHEDLGADAGIDLVAIEDVTDNPRIFAIQAKFYAEDAKIRKNDGIDSFFSAMGKKPYTDGLLFLTTYQASEHVNNLVQGRDKPINIVSLFDLENSQIDWENYQPSKAPVLREKKQLRPHQVSALNAVTHGLQTHERGKMIMACGTGKTFTSLKISEQQAGKGKRVLFLVPSLSLLSQTLTEWTQESGIPLHSFAVCSDSDVGKKREKDDDKVQTFKHELGYPSTTDPERLAKEIAKRHDVDHMTVVFSTYHSIDVISRAQKLHGLPDFDLVISDEAHRTTGATFNDDDESNFVRVHDDGFLKASKRLYMTATPRIYGELAKASAERDDVALCSMDDASLYGPELYVITFSEAVRRGLLVDYKVLVLAVEEAHVNRRLQNLLNDGNNQLKVDDAAKIIGCWKALAKQGLEQDLELDPDPMKRAVAFCQVIEASKGAKSHKVSSKNIAAMFQAVVESYQESADEDEAVSSLTCEAEHVDGSMNASAKDAKLAWLKAETPAETCRILSNVRCLSEGVDVPALDAVLFLTPRNSQVDVVQSVGRVMRNAPGKKKGYVVLPVVIPAGVEPHEALNDNKVYGVVWQVLQALRSHDDQFDADVNKIDLTGHGTKKIEIIAVTDKIQRKPKGNTPGESTEVKKKRKAAAKARGGQGIGAGVPGVEPEQQDLEFEIGEIERAIYAKLVQKVGNRHHWEEWANDIANIARTHIDRIKAILENTANATERTAFESFAAELRDDLNNSVTDDEIVEMLAQHLITKPVFDALFSDYSFAKHNPMSKAMQGVLDVLQQHNLDKEADTLQKFYDSVKMRAEGIDNAAGKQKIIVELYDKFFRNAFPKMTERLGIVYTPVEVVDFIIHSINHLLQQEFDQTLGSKGVHIIDPFTGTGTFVARLLRSGLINPEELAHKYKHEIHANEIVLLAYYIAAINIEATYHELVKGKYTPFEGICLTDTFQMYEKDDLVSELTVDNSARRKRQKKLDIRVIMGNPPYSIGQKEESDDTKKVVYPSLDERIRRTYAANSSATLSKGLYDSYIRAIRWASDRIGQSGVIGFVTNAGFLEANTADGLRKCLADEFSSIYIFHLRGNQRTAGEQSRREGGKIFGSGSRAPIAISLLVKNPKAAQHGQIYFHDIGDYLSREDKLEKIIDFSSVAGITVVNGWQNIAPDEHGDWLRQRDDSYSEFLALGDKKTEGAKLFENFSQGVLTARDAWAYNNSQDKLQRNMKGMIGVYNSEVKRFNATHSSLDKKAREDVLDRFIDTNPTRISWTRSLKQELAKNRNFEYERTSLRSSLYRPFTKQWVYFNRRFNEMVYQMPRIFPDAGIENLLICVAGTGGVTAFSVTIARDIPNYDCLAKGQCFPLYLYDEEAQAKTNETPDMFSATTMEPKRPRRDGITDSGLQIFKEAYPGEAIEKEDIFYYVYGLLHSTDYRERYADNLSKELPRIPHVKTAADFWAFSQAGRALAEYHLNYETVQPHPLTIEAKGPLTDDDYRVEKMKFAKKGDKTTVIYNGKITINDIPETAWDYVVNGKAALDWVMERQRVKIDKDSGIVNDANDWAVETMGNPKYPLELFQRVVTVSLETQKIVAALPALDI